METNQAKIEQNPPQKTLRLFLLSQVLIRLAASGASLSAALIMAKNEESTLIYGLPMTAKYTYSNAFRFLVIANSAAFGYSIVSLAILLMLTAKASIEKNFFFVFMLDLIVMGLLTAASSAAAAIGYVAKHGNEHTGWSAICPYVSKFCDKGTYAVACSFAASSLFLLLTVLSAMRPRSPAVSC